MTENIHTRTMRNRLVRALVDKSHLGMSANEIIEKFKGETTRDTLRVIVRQLLDADRIRQNGNMFFIKAVADALPHGSKGEGMPENPNVAPKNALVGVKGHPMLEPRYTVRGETFPHPSGHEGIAISFVIVEYVDNGYRTCVFEIKHENTRRIAGHVHIQHVKAPNGKTLLVMAGYSEKGRAVSDETTLHDAVEAILGYED
jgi:hypothetical protein